jgi:hypothetical protein
MVSSQIIGGYEVPLTDDVSLNKVAYDIENPQIRKTDFTKSITIPSTAETNKLFENLFDVKVALQTFNPNLKTSYQLIIDGISVLNGYCQLIDIVIVDGLINYVLNAKGAVGDLYQSIGEAKLEDLDFISLNHTWNKTNIEASWTPTLGSGYVYPMIDWGVKSSQQIWQIEDFKPAIFLKEYIDKIFAGAGYTYTSTFFTSTRFKSLVIPQSSDVVSLSDATIKDRQFVAERDATNQTGIAIGDLSSPSGMGTLIFNNVGTPFYNTSGNDYNATNGKWTVAEKGNYSFKGYIKSNFVYTEVSTQTTQWLNYVLSQSNLTAYISFAIVRERSSVETIVDVAILDITAEMTSEIITSSYTSPNFTASFKSAAIDFQVGDIVSLRISGINLKGRTSGSTNVSALVTDSTLTLQTDSQLGTTVEQKHIGVGETMTMSDTTPKNIKQKDLLNAIIKRFNLYLEYDADNDKNIIIEPREDYLTTDIEDLQMWVDRSKDYIIKPLGALDSGQYRFTDKEDEDVANVTYQTRKGDVYGNKLIVLDNDFQTSEKVIETIFAACPLVLSEGNDRIISSIAFPRDLGGFAQEVALPKLLYWGGLLDTNYNWFLDDGSTFYTKTTYPYAGHLDNPYNPTFDLSWGVPKLLFYDFSAGGLLDLLYTDSNCFNIYWKQYIEEITDKDSKILEVHLVLDAHRYDLLSFRKQYFIDGVYWRLLDVSDFNPLDGETVKCRFIKLAAKDSFTGEQKEIYGGGGVFTGGDGTPKQGMLSSKSNGSTPSNNVLNYGDSVVSGRQSIQNSDNILSGSGIKQTFTSGSDGARLLAPRTAAINSPNVEIVRPDEMYVNGVYLEKLVEITLTAAQMKTLNTSPFQIIQSPNSDEYIRITRGYIRMSGTNFTNTSRLLIRTMTTESVLIQTSTTFFDTSSNAEIMELQTEVADFGESIELYQSADMEGTGSSVTIKLIYQIIQF